MTDPYRDRRRGQRGRSTERGSYIIEAGICFMIFFVMLLGVLDVARGIYTYNFLAGAAREGSRYAMIHGNSSGAKATATDVQTVVRTWLMGVPDPANATVTTTWTPATEVPGSLVNVRVQYTFTPITTLLTGPWTLSSTSQTTVLQ